MTLLKAQKRVYEPSKVASFRTTREQFGGLSNMAPGFPIQVNRVRIRTLEALYQACRYPNRPDVQRLIVEQRSPMTAKMKGKRYLDHTRCDWGKIRVNVMRWCLRVKLAQNWRSFSELLLSTGDVPIVEESRRDDFWGAKPADGMLVGMNVLGRLLVELREELKEPDHGYLRTVEPLLIPEFLLYGQPIGRLTYSDGRGYVETVHRGHELATTQVSLENMDVEQQSDMRRSPREYEMRNGNYAIPRECKRLAEIDFPIAEVSRHAAREKSIRHGHPSTLHLWWARRPLASSRAVLMALLLPDPCDEHCPQTFKPRAREILLAMRTRPGGWNEQFKTDEGLRRALLQFIADFANWDNSAKSEYLETGRALVRAAHPEETPLVVDPFAGGGSIPLEALRLGCDSFASDLNPVACLILKVMLEDIPRHGSGLADEFRKAGAEIKAKAETELADLYPNDPDGATPIAYLWARTVRCEAPDCGAEIPLMRSMWLCRKPNRKWALRTSAIEPIEGSPEVAFEIFEPESDADVANGTVSRAKATCVCCHSVLPPERVRSQLSAQRGGADAMFDEQGNRTGGARMTAVVTVTSGERGRHYRLPTTDDYVAVRKAQEHMARILDDWEQGGRQGLCPVPDEPTPAGGGSGAGRAFSVQRYGMLEWGDLFTARQKAALAELAKQVHKEYTVQGVVEALGLTLSKVADFNSAMARWATPRETSAATFGRQALPMIWDFCETRPIGDSTGSLEGAAKYVSEFAKRFTGTVGQMQPADATNHPLPDQSAGVWFTDPPYYDAVPYADLSDFFLVWLKRTLPGHPLLRDPFDSNNPLSPKIQEVVQDETKRDGGRRKDRAWFEDSMASGFAEGRRILDKDGIGSVVFAHKTTEGWEALLSGMIHGGWTITGSWPIATERPGRLRSQESAALVTSVHLICRPRPEDAPVGDWADVLRELPEHVADWMQRLQGEGVRGADLVFACVGPALEIYSRYSRVETAEGREVDLAEYLERVWEEVGREALEQVLGTAEAQARNGAAGALEEDSRLTALFLWTIQSTSESPPVGNGAGSDDDDSEETPRRRMSGYSLPFDVTRRFAQPLGIHLDDWESRIIETKKGVVRLLPVTERGKQLFGESGAAAVADEMEASSNVNLQLSLFSEEPPTVRGRARRRRRSASTTIGDTELTLSATTLDRVHAAMLLQASGRSQALRNLLRAEQERSPDFLRLANALTALYPRGSEEKRLLDAMLLAVPR